MELGAHRAERAIENSQEAGRGAGYQAHAKWEQPGLRQVFFFEALLGALEEFSGELAALLWTDGTEDISNDFEWQTAQSRWSPYMIS